MTFLTSEIMALPDEPRQRAINAGRLDPTHVYLTLPDDFDFGCPPPASVKPPAARLRGLGDAVAAIAQPIARTLDAVTGSNLANCPACSKRQETLNHAFPFRPPSAN